MAITQSSVTANIGDGIHITRALSGTAREVPISTLFCLMFARDRGTAAATAARLGAAITAAAFAEAASAVTPTTLPTVTQVNVTPAGSQASVGWTDEAWIRAVPINSPDQILTREAIYAAKVYPGADSTVGVGGYQYTQVSAAGGNTGGALSFAALQADALTVRQAVKSARVAVISVIEQKGYSDLSTEAFAASSTILNHLHYRPDLIAGMFHPDSPVRLEESGYVGSLDATHHVFREHNSDHLATSSGDKVGCTFVPAFDFLSGNGYMTVDTIQSELMPAFGLAYDPDPVPASRETYMVVKDLPGPAGLMSACVRAGVGQRVAVVDVFQSNGSAILNQSGAVKTLYLA